MNIWQSLLKADPTDWLLEDHNPSVRCFTLTEILEEPPNAPAVKKARAAIMKAGTVPAILAQQRADGCWVDPRKFYTAKYRGAVWQLIILAELGADAHDPRVKSACEFILHNSQDPQSGGFAMNASAAHGGGRHSEVIPCLTGNMVWALIRLGYLDDPRLRRAIDWIAAYQRFDDGIPQRPQGWPYDRLEMCFGRHTCHMGAVKALKALAEIPPARRTRAVGDTIRRGVEYLLLHHIHKQSHDLSRVSKPGWLRLGFPLMYQTDVLEILAILVKLGCRDPRMREALDLVVAKQNGQGRWLLENSFNGRFVTSIEQKGKPSKWITLRALAVLKGYFG